MQIGAQLYTCHKRTQTLEDLDLSLRKIADIGYRSVQVSGTCAFSPEWMRDELQKYGLECPVTHVSFDRIVNDTENVVREHAVFGCRRIGLSFLPQEMQGSMEGYEEYKKLMLPAALKMRDMGAKFCFHNHWYDFGDLGGKNVLEHMLADFPEDSIDFILDLGWAAFAEQDVLKLIEQFSGRLDCIHLKDYADMPADGSITTNAYLRPIFEGKLDYTAYIEALDKVGCKYMLVEQDYCYDEDEFECLRRSYENVTARFPKVK